MTLSKLVTPLLFAFCYYAAAQTRLVNSADVYKSPDGSLVMIEHFTADDGGAVEVHTMPFPADSEDPSVRVFKVVKGQAPITGEIAAKPSYILTLKDGYCVLFTTGASRAHGVRTKVTRMLPRLIRSNVEVGKDGIAVETEQFYSPDRKQEITIQKKHQIGANGGILSPVRSVRLGDTDITPEIRSGKRAEVAADGRILRFTFVPDPSGAKEKTVVIVKGDN